MSGQAVRETTGAKVQAQWEAGEGARLVDVREQEEWDEYHIPDVLLMPMSEFAARCQTELEPGDQIVCICEHGVRSARAAAYLASLGYTDVATMIGGMSAYPGQTESGGL